MIFLKFLMATGRWPHAPHADTGWLVYLAHARTHTDTYICTTYTYISYDLICMQDRRLRQGLGRLFGCWPPKADCRQTSTVRHSGPRANGRAICLGLAAGSSPPVRKTEKGFVHMGRHSPCNPVEIRWFL